DDSEQGGDFDQDLWGTLDWELDAVANTIKVTTATVAESTNQGQGFGYAISGTTKDGPHFHSGIEGFTYSDTNNVQIPINSASDVVPQFDLQPNSLNPSAPILRARPPAPPPPVVLGFPAPPYPDLPQGTKINVSGGCAGCQVGDPPTTATYQL